MNKDEIIMMIEAADDLERLRNWLAEMGGSLEAVPALDNIYELLIRHSTITGDAFYQLVWDTELPAEERADKLMK